MHPSRTAPFDARRMRQRVFHHLLETRGWKYRAFLRYLRLFKYFSFSPARGTFLASYYTLMRYLDDIVDGDAPLPQPFTHPVEYLKEKIRFAEHPIEPKDEADFLLLYCDQLGRKFGEDFRQETDDILHSLLFDARRRGQWIIYPARELEAHFHTLDIRGTIRATLKLFREDPDKYPLLEALGTATRYHYDLQDFEDDIRAGFVNIAAEDCARFGITPELLHQKDSTPVRQWFRHHAQEGMQLLEQHRRNLPKGNFSWLARATFPLVYEGPARNFFRKVLDGI